MQNAASQQRRACFSTTAAQQRAHKLILSSTSLRCIRCRSKQLRDSPATEVHAQDGDRQESGHSASTSGRNIPSISSVRTNEWAEKYAYDGCVDLWVEEEFNSGSRLVGGRDTHKGQKAGTGSGEGPSRGGVPTHKIKIFNHHTDQELDVEVPEDRYILFEAEDQGLLLPWACRMGCCTTCAVRVKEGQVFQPQFSRQALHAVQSLGVSKELKDAGYALMCVAFPQSDAVLETVEEDEVYDLQFGKSFAERALKPSDKDSIERDDFAWEMANMDE